MLMRIQLLGLLLGAGLAGLPRADVVYGYKHGTAVVMDVLSPSKADGAGVSGGMNCQPKYTVPEIVQRMQHNGARFQVDAERIGILGFSSGAVVSYYGGGDITNFGAAGRTILDSRLGQGLHAPFDFHDRDQAVPLRQSKQMLELPEKAGVPAKLEMKAGQGHGWEPGAAEPGHRVVRPLPGQVTG